MLEPHGKKRAANVVKSIPASRERRWTTAPVLGSITSVSGGAPLAEPRARCSVDVWYEEQARRTLSAVPASVPRWSDSVRRLFARARLPRLLEKLAARGVSREQPVTVANTEGPLLAMSFCVTGVLSKKREDVHQDIRDAGGEVHDKVKKGTTYLVAGEKTGKAKLDGARKFGARVIDEQGLAALIRGEAPTAVPPAVS